MRVPDPVIGPHNYQDQLRALAEASVRIAGAPTLESVLHETTEQARGIIGAHLAATHLLTDQDWAKARVVVSLSDKYQQFRAFASPPFGAGIYTEAIRTNRPIRLNGPGLQEHSRWRGFSQYAHQHPPLSGLLAAPLIAGSKAKIGVIMVSDRHEGAFTAEDEAILAQLAQLASILIEKSQAEQALRYSEHKLRATYEHASVGIIEADATGLILKVNEAFCAIAGYSRDELAGVRFFDLTHVDDVEGDQERYRQQVAGEVELYQLEKRYVRRNGETAWVLVSSSAVRDGEGRFAYSVRVVQDITHRKQAEDRQGLLMNELDHRVKNTLARVQSIAFQTLRASRSPQAFYEAFEARLQSLSNAHNRLNEAGWSGASLRSLIEGELAPYRTGNDGRFALQGPDLVLSARETLSLSLVFHELATNAAKYGALSTASGRVVVQWAVAVDRGEDCRLTLDWRELDGPAVTPPDVRGFGTRLIQASVGHELGGTVELEFNPSGVRCSMELSLSR